VLVNPVLDHRRHSWLQTYEVAATDKIRMRFRTARENRGWQPEGTDREGGGSVQILPNIGIRDAALGEGTGERG
jgi:hypothetical protein